MAGQAEVGRRRSETSCLGRTVRQSQFLCVRFSAIFGRIDRLIDELCKSCHHKEYCVGCSREVRGGAACIRPLSGLRLINVPTQHVHMYVLD